MIPIVFITDKNMILQTGVTITSLLLNTNKSYEIIILIDETVSEIDKCKLLMLEENFHIKIKFIEIDNEFNDIIINEKYWSKANLYRLLLPYLLKEYDKVIYSDVDIIFRKDIYKIYDEIDNNYLVACVTPIDAGYSKSIGIEASKYICAGFLVMNLKRMREDNLTDKFMEILKNNYKYMDQDILNIICKNNIKYVSPFIYGFDQSWYTKVCNKDLMSKEILIGLNEGLIHYTGKEKPWNYPCPRNDVWWYYYQKSIYFDNKYYYFKQSLMHNGDYFSLFDRCKLIVRYFIGKRGLFRSNSINK